MANANQSWIDCAVKTVALETSQCNREGLYNIVGVGLWLSDCDMCEDGFRGKFMFESDAIIITK